MSDKARLLILFSFCLFLLFLASIYYEFFIKKDSYIIIRVEDPGLDITINEESINMTGIVWENAMEKKLLYRRGNYVVRVALPEEKRTVFEKEVILKRGTTETVNIELSDEDRGILYFGD